MTNHSRFAAVLLATSLALAGCSENTRETSAGPVAFTQETNADGATVFMRGRTDPLAPNRLYVDVIARGAPDVHGAAFRVTWDASSLAYVESKNGMFWSKDALAMVKEGSPGQLAVVWTEQGEMGIDATHETVIGTLTFETRGRDATSLAFKTERSQLVDRKGVKLDAKWHGGTVAAR